MTGTRGPWVTPGLPARGATGRARSESQPQQEHAVLDFISDLPLIGGFLSTAIAFVAMLSVVVFVHEYGHYIVGRWCGIRAETFSLGFGPVLTRWRDKRGTVWQVAALPLGGFVKFVGDADGSSRADPEAMAQMDADTRAHSFHGVAVWKRMLTVAAGPVANFILSAVIFAGLFMWRGDPVEMPYVGEVLQIEGVDQTLREGDLILSAEGQRVESYAEVIELVRAMDPPGPMQMQVERDGAVVPLTVPYPLPPLVNSVEISTPAARAGLEQGDLILSIAGQPIQSFGQLRDTVLESGDTTLPMTVLREGQVLDIEITPRVREIMEADGSISRRALIGITGDILFQPQTRSLGLFAAAQAGVVQVYDVIAMSLTGIKHILTGELGADNLSGPIGIAQVSGQAATHSLFGFIGLVATISTAIGLLNLFPIPVLDGGHLVMHAYEAIARRPPAEKVMRLLMTVGLAMVLLLMVFATYNDLMRLVVS